MNQLSSNQIRVVLRPSTKARRLKTRELTDRPGSSRLASTLPQSTQAIGGATTHSSESEVEEQKHNNEPMQRATSTSIKQKILKPRQQSSSKRQQDVHIGNPPLYRARNLKTSKSDAQNNEQYSKMTNPSTVNGLHFKKQLSINYSDLIQVILQRGKCINRIVSQGKIDMKTLRSILNEDLTRSTIESYISNNIPQRMEMQPNNFVQIDDFMGDFVSRRMESVQCKQRCQEKENKINWMIEERLNQLQKYLESKS